MPFLIVRDDLASLSADALVVTANEELRIEGTVGAAVAEVAGIAELQAACESIGHCAMGSAVLTPAFAAPARHIVHAVGPVWRGGDAGEAALLAATVRTALWLAWDAGDRSLAMPLISAGTNGYPIREALEIHTDVIADFLDGHDMEITLALYDRRAVIAGTELELDIQAYIDDVYVESHVSFQSLPLGSPRDVRGASHLGKRRFKRLFERVRNSRGRGSILEEGAVPRDAGAPPIEDAGSLADVEALSTHDGALAPAMGAPFSLSDLENRVAHLDLSFSQTLLHLIDLAGKTDAEVYKRANISRQLFSKIRSDAHYRPTKKTVVALAVALELSLEETEDLLARAGFALSHSRLFDVIVEFFIELGEYDIFTINEVLYAYDQELLGS